MDERIELVHVRGKAWYKAVAVSTVLGCVVAVGTYFATNMAVRDTFNNTYAERVA